MRDAMLAIGLAVLIGAGGGWMIKGSAPSEDAAEIDPRYYKSDYRIVYVGVETCGPCKVWRKHVYPEWKQSPLAPYISVTQVHHPNFRAFRGKRHFGQEWLVEQLLSGGGISTPTFVVVRDKTIIRRGTGQAGWERALAYIEKRMPKEIRRQAG